MAKTLGDNNSAYFRVIFRSGFAGWCSRGALLILAITATTALADGGRIILKDGFVLEGNVVKEKTIINEGGTPFRIYKADGFTAVDAGAKSTIFSHKQLLKVEDTSAIKMGDTLRFVRQLVNIEHFKLPPGTYEKISPWDKNWDRTLTLLAATGQKYKIEQRLTVLTPEYARVEGKRYHWIAYFMTSEMDPAVVKDLLYDHPDLKQTGDAKDVEKRYRVISFLIRAKMLDMAAAELSRLEKDFPAEKERVEGKRREFQKFVVTKFVDLIELANRTGRHSWAQTKLATVPKASLDENTQSRTQALTLKYDELNTRCDAARSLLTSLLAKLTDDSHKPFLTEAISTILGELNLESAARLETFISQAQQAQRDWAKNKADAQTPEQLLSLAITSWLLNSTTAEAKLDSAERLWKTRLFLQRYLETSEQTARQHMLKEFESQGGTPIDEVAAVIKLLPPPEPYHGLMSPGNPWILAHLPFPEAALWNVVATTFLRLPATHVAMRTPDLGPNKPGVSYLVQAPPEYAPGRQYPVLIALHENGTDASNAMSRWGQFAARHGYLLVAPAWERYAKQPYQFTVEEQAGALEVLRDLRRHYWIDSDRVFLGGFAEGGNMALDVGYSHPDLFAGVVCVGGRPKRFTQRYKWNAQYLPCYFVGGELDGDSMTALRSQFQETMMRGFPWLLSMYKGRGQEWFPGELTAIFDWLDRKKRVLPYPELGRGGLGGINGQEFCSMRTTDDRFYWLSGSGLNPRNINDPLQWNAKIGPAYIQGKGSDKNLFNLNVRGFKRLTLWLAPSMIDFEKPVNVYLNGRKVLSNKKVQLSMQTMLEDFYKRADPAQLYMGKLEFSP
jgi:predicted esterase